MITGEHKRLLAQSMEDAESSAKDANFHRQRAIGAEALAEERKTQIGKLESRLEAAETRIRELTSALIEAVKPKPEQLPVFKRPEGDPVRLPRIMSPHSRMRQLDANLINSAIDDHKNKLLKASPPPAKVQ